MAIPSDRSIPGVPGVPGVPDVPGVVVVRRGLAADLQLLTRRRWLGLVARTAAGIALVPAAGCEGGADGASDAAGGGSCPRIPEETAGPFPGDGSNGPDALAQAGVVRSDIRPSFAGATGVAEGVPLVVVVTVVGTGSCAPLAGRAVYLWHCDRDGNYSMYSAGVTDQNYLRGVQVSDAAGQVSFTTIVPGCYPGRWPHMHFEVFSSLAAATSGSGKLATSQLALPEAPCREAYATAGYTASLTALADVSLASDGVFRDGATLELATVTGSLATGYTAALTVAIDS